jgi:galactonate dehydratase
VQTKDEALYGWGEASLPFKIASVDAEIHALASVIVGMDPFRIEHLWQLMYRRHSRGGLVTSSAIAGIDQALWDLKARALRVPLYDLLGGRVRDRVRVYDHLQTPLRDHDWSSPAGFAEAAVHAVADGFGALKIYPIPSQSRSEGPGAIRWADSVVRSVREAVGDDVELIIDLHGRTDPATAIRYAHAFEQYEPTFLEDPCAPESAEALAAVARATRIPLAIGERLSTRWEFARALTAGACAVVQPDVAYCAGISEFRRITDLAQLHLATVAPHNSGGPVGTLHSIHLASSLPNFLILEQLRLDVPWRDDLVTSPPEIREGFAELPTGAGIGADVDEEACSAHPYTPCARPRSFSSDGSVLDE